MIDPASTDTQDFELEPSGDLAVRMTSRHADRIDPGETTTATFSVANADTVTVDAAATGLFGPDDLSLAVDGADAAFGDPVALDASGIGTEHEIGVTASEPAFLGQVSLSYTFANADGERVGESHRVHVHTDPLTIQPDDPPSLQGPIDLVAPRSTIELADGATTEAVTPDAGHAFVVDKPLTITAAADANPRVEVDPPSEDASDPTGVLVTANDVTIEGLAIDAPAAASAIRVGSRFQGGNTTAPSGVTIRETTVSSATVGIHGLMAPALRIEACDVTADGTGILDQGPTTTAITANVVHDVEAGIDAQGQVTSLTGNEVTDVAGTAITIGLPRHLLLVQQLALGAVANNTVRNATVGIAVPRYTDGAIRDNTLTDIADTAIAVTGGVFAPITNNTIDTADTAIHVADDATVDSISNNALRNVTTPGAATRAPETTAPSPETATTGTPGTTQAATTLQGTATSTGDGDDANSDDDGTTEADGDGGLASPTGALTTVAVTALALAKALTAADDGE
jgi:hypothetical protein